MALAPVIRVGVDKRLHRRLATHQNTVVEGREFGHVDAFDLVFGRRIPNRKCHAVLRQHEHRLTVGHERNRRPMIGRRAWHMQPLCQHASRFGASDQRRFAHKTVLVLMQANGFGDVRRHRGQAQTARIGADQFGSGANTVGIARRTFGFVGRFDPLRDHAQNSVLGAPRQQGDVTNAAQIFAPSARTPNRLAASSSARAA